MKYSSPYDRWLAFGEAPGSAVYSPRVNRRLAADDRILVRRGGHWRPPVRVQGRDAAAASSLRFNETKLRLATDLTAESADVLIEETDYAAFLVTNWLAYEQWFLGKRTTPPFDEIGLKDGRIPNLAQSVCSNHMGGDVLAVGPGKFWLQRNAAGNRLFPEQYVASSSGSFDMSDAEENDDLVSVLKRGLLRELCEEMDLEPSSAPRPEDIRVIGYSRATYLGGKPQFYGVARTHDLIPGIRECERRYVMEHSTHTFDCEARGEGLLAALKDFINGHRSSISPPLQLLALVLADWISETGSEEWLFADQCS